MFLHIATLHRTLTRLTTLKYTSPHSTTVYDNLLHRHHHIHSHIPTPHCTSNYRPPYPTLLHSPLTQPYSTIHTLHCIKRLAPKISISFVLTVTSELKFLLLFVHFSNRLHYLFTFACLVSECKFDWNIGKRLQCAFQINDPFVFLCGKAPAELSTEICTFFGYTSFVNCFLEACCFYL